MNKDSKPALDIRSKDERRWIKRQERQVACKLHRFLGLTVKGNWKAIYIEDISPAMSCLLPRTIHEQN